MAAMSTEVKSGGIEITVVSGEGNKTGQSTKEFQYRVSKIATCLVFIPLQLWWKRHYFICS